MQNVILSSLSLSLPPPSLSFTLTDMAETLRYLLVGSGEITENLEVNYILIKVCYCCVKVLYVPPLQLTSRSPNEVYEILSLAGYVPVR